MKICLTVLKLLGLHSEEDETNTHISVHLGANALKTDEKNRKTGFKRDGKKGTKKRRKENRKKENE
jgi:type IV secretory pathway TraG/TraD family ATPase VirD4